MYPSPACRRAADSATVASSCVADRRALLPCLAPAAAPLTAGLARRCRRALLCNCAPSCVADRRYWTEREGALAITRSSDCFFLPRGRGEAAELVGAFFFSREGREADWENEVSRGDYGRKRTMREGARNRDSGRALAADGVVSLVIWILGFSLGWAQCYMPSTEYSVTGNIYG